MMRISKLLLVAALGLFIGTGCLSYTTVHTATPLEQGKGSFKGTAGYASFNVPTTSSGDRGTLNLPTTEMQVRYGLGNDMEIGGKIFLVGAGLDFNWALINNPDFALSLNPGVSYTGIGTAGGDESGGSAQFGTGVFNILADVVKTDNVTVTVGPKPGLIYISDGQETVTSGVLGGTAGVSFQAAENFALEPWFDAIYNFEGNTLLYTAQLGFSVEFGGAGSGN